MIYKQQQLRRREGQGNKPGRAPSFPLRPLNSGYVAQRREQINTAGVGKKQPRCKKIVKLYKIYYYIV